MLARVEQNLVFVAHFGVAGKKVYAEYLGKRVVEKEEIVEIAVSVEDGDVDFEEVEAAEDVVETGTEVVGTVVDVEFVVFAIVAAAAVVVAEMEINA